MHNSIYCFTCKHDPKLHLQIACYASLYGISATVTYYAKKLGHCVWTCTIHCIKSAYQDEIRKIRASGNGEPLDSLPHKKQGKPVRISKKVDGKVTAWIKRVREPGGSVSSQVMITTAHGILTSLEQKNQGNLEVMWI